MPGCSTFSASSWAVVPGDERSAQQQDAALARRQRCRPARGRTGQDRGEGGRAACDDRRVRLGRPEPAGDDLEVGVRLGIGYDDRRTAAREGRPDPRSDRVATARRPDLGERDLDRVARREPSVASLLRPAREARIAVREIAVGRVLGAVQRHARAIAVEQMDSAEGHPAGRRQRGHEQQRHAGDIR